MLQRQSALLLVQNEQLAAANGLLHEKAHDALSDVRAWRLDRRIFHEIVRRRPALAEDVSSILARRRTALEALRDCWRGRRATMDQLMAAARVCRMENVMRPYLESLV